MLVVLQLLLQGQYCLAQKTPEELGQVVFGFFKTQNTAALDTMTLSCAELKEYYQNIDTTLVFLKDPELCAKHAHHDSLFKSKCDVIINNKRGHKINWENATFAEVIHTEKKMSRKIPIHFLDVVFISDKQKYVIQFKGVCEFKGLWKLGEEMRIREVSH